MRELAGKGCLCLIAAILGIFIGNEFYWSVGFPPLVAHLISVVATVAIAWFLIRETPAKK